MTMWSQLHPPTESIKIIAWDSIRIQCHPVACSCFCLLTILYDERIRNQYLISVWSVICKRLYVLNNINSYPSKVSRAISNQSYFESIVQHQFLQIVVHCAWTKMLCVVSTKTGNATNECIFIHTSYHIISKAISSFISDRSLLPTLLINSSIK